MARFPSGDIKKRCVPELRLNGIVHPAYQWHEDAHTVPRRPAAQTRTRYLLQELWIKAETGTTVTMFVTMHACIDRGCVKRTPNIAISNRASCDFFPLCAGGDEVRIDNAFKYLSQCKAVSISYVLIFSLAQSREQHWLV